MSHHIWITEQFDGVHAWPEAPERRYYLRTPHRHRFHVRVEVFVTHSDRDVEFHDLQAHVRAWVAQQQGLLPSCEAMAEQLGKSLGALYDPHSIVRVDISEDGENGGAWMPDTTPSTVGIVEILNAHP